LVCQALIAKGVPWFQFYFGSLVLSAINVTFLVLTFKPTASEFLRDRESAMAGGRIVNGQTSSSDDGKGAKPTTVDKRTTTQRKSRIRVLSICFLLNITQLALCMALKLRYQWAVTLFALLYCGWYVLSVSLGLLVYSYGRPLAKPQLKDSCVTYFLVLICSKIIILSHRWYHIY